MTFTTGMDWHGPKVTKDMEAGALKGLRLGVEHWLGESRKQVPIEEGTLERSGVASVDRATLTGAVSYDTVYAARQHEELGWQHDEGRKAKYVEDPMNDEREVIGDLVAAEIRRGLKS